MEGGVKNGVFAMEVCIDDIDKVTRWLFFTKKEFWVALFYLDEVFPITMNRDKLLDVFHRLPQLKFELCTEKPKRALPERLVFRSHVSVGNIASFIQSGLMQPNNFSRHFDGTHYLDYRGQKLPRVSKLLRRADCEQYDPYGALFFAFKCRGQYESDVWIDSTEPKDGHKPWPRAYHGTSYQNIQKILEVSDGQLVPGIRNVCGTGVYMSPDPRVAQSYAHPYNYRGKCYKAALMVYPNPDKLERIDWRGSTGAYWVVKDYEQSIRLAGLCIWPVENTTIAADYVTLQQSYDKKIGEVKVANGLVPHKPTVSTTSGPVLQQMKGVTTTVLVSRNTLPADEEPLLSKPSTLDPIEVQIAYMAQCERLAAVTKEKSTLEEEEEGEEVVFEDYYFTDEDEEDGEEVDDEVEVQEQAMTAGKWSNDVKHEEHEEPVKVLNLTGESASNDDAPESMTTPNENSSTQLAQ